MSAPRERPPGGWLSEGELEALWSKRTRARGRMPSVVIEGRSDARFELRDGKVVRVTEPSEQEAPR